MKTTQRVFFQLFLLSASVFFFGCALSYDMSFYYTEPSALKNNTEYLSYIEKVKPYIEGKTICIDPGHGGKDPGAVSPQEFLNEADINLRVALALERFCIDAGAYPILTRTKDEYISLVDRIDKINRSKSVLFLSIHHNALGEKMNFGTNYTATFYHSMKDDSGYAPCSQDIARYVQRDLSYVMDNPGGLGSFDGTYSDYAVYPGEGFAVLRKTTIPGVLIECGFVTHPREEIRLQEYDFNRVQAYGIFNGLYKYFRAGQPLITYYHDESQSEFEPNLSYRIEDASGINNESIRVFINGEEKEYFTYLPENKLLIIPMTDEVEGVKEVVIWAANNNGVFAFPFKHSIYVSIDK